ncbi:DUF4380 domain-containing protein [Pseudonocardia nematodicida]|uniref:DUF4380 domain-containing protein n=1 Tax=Pseudonocardia nematodicida TaxID=1206997 RepID=A0ABV1K5Z5_9PSEU
MSTARVEAAAGGRVLWLDNGIVRLGLVPELGGRLLSLSRTGGPELLWRDDRLVGEDLLPRVPHRPHSGRLGDWVNYGGDKTWPAPQGWDHDGQWAGPPDPVLDSGPYRAEVRDGDGTATVTLTSGDDPRTGLGLTRCVELDDDADGYRLRLTARNTSDRPVRWALWNVTQLDGEGPGHTEVAGPAEVVDLLAGTGFPRWSDGGGLVRVPHQDVVGKLGFPAATGRLSHTGRDAVVTVDFPVDPDADYPDRGSRAEIWIECPQPAPLAALGDLDPPARIVECEVLGPLTELGPGEQTTLDIVCTVEAGEGST